MTSLRFCGINLNGELCEEGDEQQHELKEIAIEGEDEVQVFSTAFHELTIKRNQLEVRSSLIKNSEKIYEFQLVIMKICASNETCWILLDGGSIYCVNLKEMTKSKLDASEKFQNISCTQKSLFGIANYNQLHQLTANSDKKLHEFPNHQKVKKMVAGAEHCLLLTTNGDVFSFGCGLRGTLGHGDVNPSDVPKQIEALAGLKIVDIAAGLFHSVAVSSFGDVYSWGWNTNGQLGLPKVAQGSFQKTSKSHQQVFTSPQLIELEDDEVVTNVYCGSKHTVLRTERNRLLVSGLNNYGQLGLLSDTEDVDEFTEMPVMGVVRGTKVSCGCWATYLVNKI